MSTCGEGGLCSGHGSCDTTIGKCKCDQTFHGEDCSAQHCVGFVEGSDECSGHGMCTLGECECAPGFGPAKDAKEGDLNDCSTALCQIDCGNHGFCNDNLECECSKGWKGLNCKDPDCGEDDCSGHGVCTFVSVHSPAQCQCDFGYDGGRCEKSSLVHTLDRCANDCTGNGLCFGGKCACNIGFRGPDCSEVVCADDAKIGPKCTLPRCPGDCDGKGLCMNGKCACWEGYMGRDCSLPAMCYETCANVCETDTTSEKCTYCIGQCETVRGHLVIGKHVPFDDLSTTFLQGDKNATFMGFSPRRPRRGTNFLQAVPRHQQEYVEDVDISAPPAPPRATHKNHHEVSVIDLNSFEVASSPSQGR